MNLKLNYIYIILFASFFFFWGVNLNFIRDLEFLDFDSKSRDFLSNFKLSYLIVILIIPILYKFIKEKSLSPNIIFNYQKYVIFFVIFVTAHFFLVKIYYYEIINKSEITNIFYLILLSIIYCHYRNFIFINFKKILIFYLIVFILFSYIEGLQLGAKVFNYGQCNNDIFLIHIIGKYLKIVLTNSIYLENSHLAMMTIAVFFSSLYILVQGKKNNILFLLLFSIEVIIVLNNLSTTFFVCYLFSQVALLLFFFKRMNIKFWIVAFLFLFANSYLFLSDKNCTTKITELSIKAIQKNDLKKNDSNLTTLIYQRSIIVAKETLLNHPLGWGIDGMDNATIDLLDNYNFVATKYFTVRNIESVPWMLKFLNLKDGLSNLLKLFTEFGLFAFLVYFYFLKYILNIKNINSYNIFIIVLFITMSIRGAGYFNGAFIFCVLEFFYHKKFTKELYKIN